MSVKAVRWKGWGLWREGFNHYHITIIRYLLAEALKEKFSERERERERERESTGRGIHYRKFGSHRNFIYLFFVKLNIKWFNIIPHIWVYDVNILTVKCPKFGHFWRLIFKINMQAVLYQTDIVSVLEERPQQTVTGNKSNRRQNVNKFPFTFTFPYLSFPPPCSNFVPSPIFTLETNKMNH